MPRNRFPKGSKVKLQMCDAPGCKCHDKYRVGEDAVVVSVEKKYIVVECMAAFKNVMARRILFSKATAAAHMELLEKPEPRKVVKKEEPLEDALPSVEPEQLKLALTGKQR